MVIKNKLLERIRKDPRTFADILKKMNSSNKIKVAPATLLRRLERKSEIVKTNSTIADYFRSKGLTEEQIFEPSK